ncbi:MAG: heavy metal translocating P-type ATPase [Francisellaceae bacterium]
MLEYKIYGLDCAEEVAMLKSALLPYIKDENLLNFNLLKGKLSIDNRDQFSIKLIEKKIKSTGLRAVLWQEYEASQTQKTTLWQRHQRLILTIISGLSLLIGFVIHGYNHGYTHALLSNDATMSGMPNSAILFYLLSLIIGGWYIYPKAFNAVKRLRADMNLLMTVAIIGSIFLGQWLEAAMIVFLFSIAMLLESWSVSRARAAIGKLFELTPEVAEVFCPHHGDIDLKPVVEINIGAIIIVKPGNRIPLDGEIIEGTSFINQSPITGESMPVEKKTGDSVFAGTLNEDSLIKIRVTRLAQNSTLAKIIQQVEMAQAKKARSEKWVEQFAKYYTPLMILLAIFIAVIPPLFGGSWYNWFYEALVILVIACPCALVISTPVSIVSGLTAAARKGLLVKGGDFLERAASIKVIAFDKTGTITEGKPRLKRLVNISTKHDDKTLMQIAWALESGSSHPLAHAVIDFAENNAIESPRQALNLTTIKGKAVTGEINGDHYWIGSHRYMHELHAVADNGDDKTFHDTILQLENSGHSLLILGQTRHILGLFAVADELRNSSKSAISKLNQQHIETVLLTGDNKGTAMQIGKEAKIHNIKAELLPEDKVDAIESLRSQYHTVAMVGDGINDAPALARADISFAMGKAGSDVAIESADIALMSDDLNKLPWLVKHSKRVMRIIKQNITFALGLKLIFIILALFELATIWMAIGADMGASLLVVFNSLRLLRDKKIPQLPTTKCQSSSHNHKTDCCKA